MSDQSFPYPACDLPNLGCPCRRPDYEQPEDGRPCDCDCHIQVTIHGRFGRGPMPVEFRDALVEMARLVKQGIDDGTIGKERRATDTPDRT